jgi:hypothetical protein|tara:strand:+ start:467 stop:982 length:516 start_codon:yes stop_codon:yes gene_type:complete
MVSRKIVFKKKQTKKNLGKKSKTPKKHHKKRRISFRVKKGGFFGKPDTAKAELRLMVKNLQTAEDTGDKDKMVEILNNLTQKGKARCGSNQQCKEDKATQYALAMRIVRNSKLLDEDEKKEYEVYFITKVVDKAVEQSKTFNEQGFEVGLRGDEVIINDLRKPNDSSNIEN